VPAETPGPLHHGRGSGQRACGSEAEQSNEQSGTTHDGPVAEYELIALDEVGYVPLADAGAEFLFQVVSSGPRERN